MHRCCTDVFAFLRNGCSVISPRMAWEALQLFIERLHPVPNAPSVPSDLPCPTRRGSKEGECHGGAGNAPIFGTWEKRHLSFTITATLEDGTSVMPWK